MGSLPMVKMPFSRYALAPWGMQPNTSPVAHFPRFPWAFHCSCMSTAYYTTLPFCMFYTFYTAEIGYWQGEGLTTEDGGQRMGDGGRTTKDRGSRCDQRALPFPCISWFKSLRPLRSLRLLSRCPSTRPITPQQPPNDHPSWGRRGGYNHVALAMLCCFLWQSARYLFLPRDRTSSLKDPVPSS